VKNRQPIRLPAGVDPVRDIMYVDDFSRACRAFIDSKLEFGLYNLGGGHFNAISLRDIIKRIGAIIEIEPVIQEDPNMPVPVPLRYVSDTTRVIDDLAWRPWLGIDAGLREIL